MKLVFLGLLVCFLSCNGQKKLSKSNKSHNNDFPLTLVLQDNYSGSDSSEILIIREAKTLRNFFASVNRTRKPGLPIPEVNFSEEMLIVVCSGIANNGSLPKLSIMEESEKQIVIGKTSELLEGQLFSTAITSPFYIYKMPVTSKEITFEELK